MLSCNLQAVGLIVLSDANFTIRQGKLLINDACCFNSISLLNQYCPERSLLMLCSNFGCTSFTVSFTESNNKLFFKEIDLDYRRLIVMQFERLITLKRD